MGQILSQVALTASGTYLLASRGEGGGPAGRRVTFALGVGGAWSGSAVLKVDTAAPGAGQTLTSVNYSHAALFGVIAAGTAITATGGYVVSAEFNAYDLYVVYTHASGAATATTQVEDVAPPQQLDVYSVLNFGAIGNGVTDDTVAIQAAIDACSASGGGVVDGANLTYLISPRVHPDTTSVAACLVLKNNVELRKIGLLLDVVPNAVPSGCILNWQLQIISNSTPYSNAATKINMRLTDCLIDGNAANQTFVAPNGAFAVFTGTARSVWVTRVICQNFYGTSASSPGETMHFEANGSMDVHYTDCEAIGNEDAGDTATGFSADTSTGVIYTGCISRNMTSGQGFTHWTCANMSYANCWAYSNGYAGFNTEISENVQYVNCIAGGRGAHTSAGIIGDQAALPNQFGFKVLGSSYVRIIGCTASYNTTSTGYGIHIAQYTTTSVNSSYVLIDGTTVVANDIGIHVADSSQTNVFLTAGNILAGNTGGLFSGTGTTASLTRYADAPLEQWDATNGTSGARFNVIGGGAFNFLRVQDNGTTVAGFTKVGGPIVGNGAAATTPGSVQYKVEVFDKGGSSLGFLALYDAIT